MIETSYISPLGTLILAVHKETLVYCNWDEVECNKKLMRMRARTGCEEYPADRDILIKTSVWLDSFFRGERIIFEIPYELNGTTFQKSVWKAIIQLNYGETISYKELAKRAGCEKAIRAVARACGENPLAIIVPCHRILGARGEIGGYTGGINKKIFLLELEAHILLE